MIQENSIKSFLNAFEEQALDGELRFFLAGAIEVLEKNNYMHFLKEKSKNYQRDSLSIAFVLYSVIGLIKLENEADLSILASDPIIEFLNPDLKNVEEKKVFAKKLFNDLKESI